MAGPGTGETVPMKKGPSLAEKLGGRTVLKLP